MISDSRQAAPAARGCHAAKRSSRSGVSRLVRSSTARTSLHQGESASIETPMASPRMVTFSRSASWRSLAAVVVSLAPSVTLAGAHDSPPSAHPERRQLFLPAGRSSCRSSHPTHSLWADAPRFPAAPSCFAPSSGGRALAMRHGPPLCGVRLPVVQGSMGGAWSQALPFELRGPPARASLAEL